MYLRLIVAILCFAICCRCESHRFTHRVVQSSTFPHRILSPCLGDGGIHGWLFPYEGRSLQVWTSFPLGTFLSVSTVKSVTVAEDGFEATFEMVSDAGEGTVMPGNTFASTVWAGYLRSTHTTKWTLWRTAAIEETKGLQLLLRLDCSGAGQQIANFEDGAYYEDNPFIHAFDNDTEIRDAVKRNHFITVGYGMVREYEMIELKLAAMRAASSSLAISRWIGLRILHSLPHLTWTWTCDGPARRSILAVTDADGLVTFPLEADLPGTWPRLSPEAVRLSVISDDAANDRVVCGVGLDVQASILETILHRYEDLVWICVALLLFKRTRNHHHGRRGGLLLGSLVFSAALGMTREQLFFAPAAAVIPFTLRILATTWISLALDGVIFVWASILLLIDKLFRWSKWPLAAPGRTFRFLAFALYIVVQVVLLGWVESAEVCITVASLATILVWQRRQSPLDRAGEGIARIFGVGPKLVQAGVLVRGVLMVAEAKMPLSLDLLRSKREIGWACLFATLSMAELSVPTNGSSVAALVAGAGILWFLRPLGLYTLLYYECSLCFLRLVLSAVSGVFRMRKIKKV